MVLPMRMSRSIRMSPSNRPANDPTKAAKPNRKPKVVREQRVAVRSTKPLIETDGPTPDTPLNAVMVSIGTVTGSHGVDGELKVTPSTDDVERFFECKAVWLGEETKPRNITSARLHAGFVLLGLSGITSKEDCQLHRGERIRIRASDAAPLEEGEFFLFQVIGLEARDESGSPVGIVVDLIETGAKPVFVIRPSDPGPDLLLPNIPEAVLTIDPTSRTMVVRPLRYAEPASSASTESS